MVEWLNKHPRTVMYSCIVIGFLLFLWSLYGTFQERTNQEHAQTILNEINKERAVEQTKAAGYVETETYINSSDYAERYLRDERGLQLEDEVRIAVIEITGTAPPVAEPTATPDVSVVAEKWQLWWYLFTDQPTPEEEYVVSQ